MHCQWHSIACVNLEQKANFSLIVIQYPSSSWVIIYRSINPQPEYTKAMLKGSPESQLLLSSERSSRAILTLRGRSRICRSNRVPAWSAKRWEDLLLKFCNFVSLPFELEVLGGRGLGFPKKRRMLGIQYDGMFVSIRASSPIHCSCIPVNNNSTYRPSHWRFCIPMVQVPTQTYRWCTPFGGVSNAKGV